MKTWYATFGSGQPGYPGYLEVTGETYVEAYAKMWDATNWRFCTLYDCLDSMHPGDRLSRGTVDEWIQEHEHDSAT